MRIKQCKIFAAHLPQRYVRQRPFATEPRRTCPAVVVVITTRFCEFRIAPARSVGQITLAEGGTAKYANRAMFRVSFAERRNCRKKGTRSSRTLPDWQEADVGREPRSYCVFSCPLVATAWCWSQRESRTSHLRLCDYVHGDSWRALRFENRMASKAGSKRRIPLLDSIGV